MLIKEAVEIREEVEIKFQGIPEKVASGCPVSLKDRFISEFVTTKGNGVLHLRKSDNNTAAALESNASNGVVIHQKINNVRYLNKFFEEINRAQKKGTFLVGSVETHYQFRKRVSNKYPAALVLPFFILHFLVKRVLPKWAVSRRLYFYLTRGRGRVISLTEVLGRLVSCGYDLVKVENIDGLTWFAVRKQLDPLFDMQPTYGPLVTLNRVGKGGKMIRIYKFRTMHPYAEYLQKYIYQLNDLDDGGKFRNDMRVTEWGRFMRKFWLDEQPMWINLFKGELKLVGVRPLSRHYFELYPEEIKELRTRYKPGLIPPFYYDLPKTFEEILDSERRYLEAYSRSPFRTDVRYLIGSLYNIFIKRARSG